MVTTCVTLPAYPLQSFIKRYSFREIDTEGEALVKPLFASDESVLTFSISSTPVLYHTGNQLHRIDLRDRHLFGLQTAYNGYQVFNGVYTMLCVEFTSNGFFSLFKMPMSHIRNNLWCFDDVIGEQLQYMNELLHDKKDYREMASAVDRFFLKALQKEKALPKYAAEISWACTQLHTNHTLDIVSLAKSTNMSLRSFEQYFIEQVGLSPVLLKRIRRFQQALEMKTTNQGESWTSIAYSCNYFDQMHLIKDFKLFSSMTPVQLFRKMPPPEEAIIPS